MLLLLLRRIAAVIAVCVLAGCTPAPAPNEPSLSVQAAAVRSGAADKIHMEETALADADLRTLSDLTNLHTLLLDHASGHFSATGLRHLIALPNLEHLRIRGPGIDDAAIAEISQLKSLRLLNLPQAEFTDDALRHLKDLPALEQLRFGSPRVTDAGMQAIAGLPALKSLHLINVPITDAGLGTLASIQQLESLYIDGSEISDAGYDDLFRRRPKLHVHLNQKHHDNDPHKHPH